MFVTFRGSRSYLQGMRNRPWMLPAGFALVAALGYWLARSAVPEEAPREVKTAPAAVRTPPADDPAPKFRRGDRIDLPKGDPDASAEGALVGQRVLVFADADALADFLRRAGESIRVLDRLDKLNALRVGFTNYDDLAYLLDGTEEESLIYPVFDPAPPEGTVQEGAVGLKNGLLEWLGITGDNSGWGAGVKIAVLDSGVASHSAFGSDIYQIALVDVPDDPANLNGHGTAVASLIIGSDPLTPGVAPGADLISIRIANDNGYSDSFLLAKGIIAAVDAGAELINISMGSFGDSRLVRNAIEYATQSGALIIAAAGNNGIDSVTYPAANQGVIAVGGVDAMGNHLAFSNTGAEINLAAPGYDIFAAWTNDKAVSVSGTSFSTPIVTGSIAAIMTQGGNGRLSAARAYELLVSHLNDAGDAGADPQLGGGMPDIGRVLDRNTPGIYDAAVASSRIVSPTPATPNGQVEVLIQNRGTETLINTSVRVTVGGNASTANITTLPPNGVRTVRVPLTRGPNDGLTNLRVETSVSPGGGVSDRKPANNRRVDTYVAAGSQ